MTLSIGSGIPKHTAIGIGMWLGLLWLLMFGLLFGQIKKSFGIVECEPELKAKSAKSNASI